ncbi:hypothetical protein SAMN04490248_10564 [Salinihabitans flavidus]|uniref:Universal stress protein family protein n=1 Tax=Salinihabitans flavidus TaxID=569882 RepID=A0A1H8PMU3_9RHOB|nr:hypothetical protein [Salinihabitans flavidus]SEO43101.1 hypothetical protein SAMN04490248_10564 [Salinihabitans flavidus]
MEETHIRILVGAGSYADARAALMIAERLAEMVRADLGGLLLEESGVFEGAISQAQRVVTLRGAQRLVPPPQERARLWEQEAIAFRNLLTDMAKRRAASWSFERREGETVGALCLAAREWDWLLIGHRKLGRHAGEVVAVLPGDGAQDGAGQLAETLARALGTSVRTVAGDASQVIEKIGRLSVCAVVTDAGNGPFREAEQIRQLVDAARAPVLVMGASALCRTLEHSTQIPPAPEPD